MSDQTDIRHAVRRLIRDWPFTIAAVLVLGLGIVANTAIFSVVNMALLRDQSVVDPDRLVEIYQNIPGTGAAASSYPAYRDIAEYTDIFANTTASLIPTGVNYGDGHVVRPAIAEYTTASYPTVLGLHPSLGRWFEAAEDAPGAGIVAVLGHQRGPGNSTPIRR